MCSDSTPYKLKHSFVSCRARLLQVIPVNANGVPIGEIPFVRSGLLGFVGPVSQIVSLRRVFVLMLYSFILGGVMTYSSAWCRAA